MFRKILIDLDSILDTRLGTISRINPEAAKYIVQSQNYWYRDFDDWAKLTNNLITNEQFIKAYGERGGENTADTINSSIVSGIMIFISKLIAIDESHRLDGLGDPLSEIALEINVWPYELDLDTKDELVDCIRQWGGLSETQITITNTPLDQLTCSLLNDKYACAIMYDVNRWCKTHMYELANVCMSDFNMIGPKLFEIDPKDLTVEEKQEKFAAFRILRLANMDFEFIDAEYFSMFKP